MSPEPAPRRRLNKDGTVLMSLRNFLENLD